MLVAISVGQGILHLGVDTLRLVLGRALPSATFGRLSGEKSVIGLGRCLSGYQLRPLRIGSGAALPLNARDAVCILWSSLLSPCRRHIMAGGEQSTAAGFDNGSNQIAALVPTFHPSQDDLQVYAQKVSLLVQAWPEGKYTELVTRLILNCSGSAFLKLQLHQELMVNDRKSVQKFVEILGGHWGQIGLEKRYDYAERVVFKCIQKADTQPIRTWPGQISCGLS